MARRADGWMDGEMEERSGGERGGSREEEAYNTTAGATKPAATCVQTLLVHGALRIQKRAMHTPITQHTHPSHNTHTHTHALTSHH